MSLSSTERYNAIRSVWPDAPAHLMPAATVLAEIINQRPALPWATAAQTVELDASSAAQLSCNAKELCSVAPEEGGRYRLFVGPRSAAIAHALRLADDYAHYAKHPGEILRIGIDIETYSSVSLADCGLYRYTEAPDFEILLFAYSINGGPAHICDFASGERLPEHIAATLTDPAVIKTAFNAAFERVCLSRWLARQMGAQHNARYLDPAQWRCTMVLCASLGLPMSLAGAGSALNLRAQKMHEGANLISYFSVPCRATKANGGRTRNLPEHAPEKWAMFRRYCQRDVDVEQEVLRRCMAIKKATGYRYEEWGDWAIDQRINDRGVLIDRVLAESAVAMDEEHRANLKAEAQALTGLDNPNSRAQLIGYLGGRGCKTETLRKADVPELLASTTDENVARVLSIRQELAKTSNAKYPAMVGCCCEDDRVRGLLQYYGTRTGRWAGRLVQVQNLPQNHLSDLDTARAIARTGDLSMMSMCFDNVPDTLSQLIRTAFVAPEGRAFVVCDFSAIEARVLAWVAGEQWVLDTFRRGGDIYCATASKMFGVPVEKHGENGHLRQKGKVATLALGYGGGVEALRAMGGARMGLTDEEMADTVALWRSANPRIVRLWQRIERALWAVWEDGGGEVEINVGIRIGYNAETRFAYISLPSGRRIYYPELERTENRFGRPSLSYMGINQTTRKWERLETYSGKLTENLIQAIARDCLMVVIRRCAEREDLPIVFHVHDEIVTEAPAQTAGQHLEDIQCLFAEPAPWAKGLPLNGAGFVTPYYKKD